MKLFSAFPQTPASDLRTDVYMETLRAYPGWAVDQARVAWMEGRGQPGANYAFLPTPPQFALCAKEQFGPVYREAAELQNILDAQIDESREFVSEDEAARRAAVVDRLCAEVPFLRPGWKPDKQGLGKIFEESNEYFDARRQEPQP